MASAPKPHL